MAMLVYFRVFLGHFWDDFPCLSILTHPFQSQRSATVARHPTANGSCVGTSAGPGRAESLRCQKMANLPT